MKLDNMRELGVQRLWVSCLNRTFRHDALLDVSSYPAKTEFPPFRRRMAVVVLIEKIASQHSTADDH